MANARPVGRAELRAMLAAHGVAPSRARGQNFLVDPNTANRIARLAEVGRGDRVVEIGAGVGSLTAALAATGASVTAIEVDRRLVAILSERVPDNVRVIEEDAMTSSWDEVLATPLDPNARWILVANLPYNVATPLLLDLLERVPQIVRFLVMVQAEVGERLVSSPGSRVYGPSSVRVAYFATARLVGRVPPDVFYPRPKVESVLVALTRRSEPAVDPASASYQEIDELVRAGFSGRRKMLRRSLAGLVTPEVFESAGIDGRARAEQLEVVEWGKLAACRRSITRSPAPS